LTASL